MLDPKPEDIPEEGNDSVLGLYEGEVPEEPYEGETINDEDTV
jgi:hypothetical protein